LEAGSAEEMRYPLIFQGLAPVLNDGMSDAKSEGPWWSVGMTNDELRLTEETRNPNESFNDQVTNPREVPMMND